MLTLFRKPNRNPMVGKELLEFAQHSYSRCIGVTNIAALAGYEDNIDVFYRELIRAKGVQLPNLSTNN